MSHKGIVTLCLMLGLIGGCSTEVNGSGRAEYRPPIPTAAPPTPEPIAATEPATPTAAVQQPPRATTVSVPVVVPVAIPTAAPVKPRADPVADDDKPPVKPPPTLIPTTPPLRPTGWDYAFPEVTTPEPRPTTPRMCTLPDGTNPKPCGP